MTFIKRFAVAATLLGALAFAPAALAQQQPTEPPKRPEGVPKQLDEFVPIEQLPQDEQIPAANLLIPAYSFVWVAVLVYVASIAKRLGTVQREVERLETDIKQGKRS